MPALSHMMIMIVRSSNDDDNDINDNEHDKGGWLPRERRGETK